MTVSGERSSRSAARVPAQRRLTPPPSQPRGGTAAGAPAHGGLPAPARQPRVETLSGANRKVIRAAGNDAVQTCVDELRMCTLRLAHVAGGRRPTSRELVRQITRNGGWRRMGVPQPSLTPSAATGGAHDAQGGGHGQAAEQGTRPPG